MLVLFLILGCTTDATRRNYLRTNARWLQGLPARPVVIVPGFGVTRLLDPDAGRFVWGTPRTAMRSRYEDDLDLPVHADGTIGMDRLLPRGYAGSRGPINVGWQMGEALRRYGGYASERDLHFFQYDWRLSARDNAVALARFVDRLEAPSVDVVAHSAGGLVALAWVKLHGGGARVTNLILLAPPQRGTVDAFRILVRPERFVRRTFAPEMVATWPSVPELLPADGEFLISETGNTIGADLWEAKSWRALKLSIYRHPPDRDLDAAFTRSLIKAREFRITLEQTPLPPGVRLHVLAGDCVTTARRALHRRDGSIAFYPDELRPSDHVSLGQIMFEPGDGTVPVTSARAGERPASLFCDGHQGLASDPNVHRALIRILRSQ